jgi:two-component system, NtrC family, sensor kinase
MESFHKALLGIHRASTTLQMEQTLNEALKDSVNMVWVRVRFNNQSSLKQQIGGHVLAIEIPFMGERMRGEVLFSKAEGKRFTADETDFLHELTDALALALSRLQKLDEAETLKGQWQATFDSIPHPLCVTTSDFEILKMNRAFQQACGTATFRDLIGKNAFTAFFGNEAPQIDPEESEISFRQARTGANETEHFEVICENLGHPLDDQAVRLVLLRPITDEVRFERRIFESSKLAELGTIGSSIAHELNNPLGGMLSFLQLILMDMKAEDPLRPEIKGMEDAVLRCRDIVVNLLGFARKQDLGEFGKIDLGDVVDRAVKLIELQSKSSGIRIDRSGFGDEIKVNGSLNALSQALCNLLQNSLDAIGDRLKAEPLFPGEIKIDLEKLDGKFRLKLTDNGLGIKPEIQSQIFNPLFTTRDPRLYGGMGLTTAFTIINEHHGILEILSQTGSGTTAIITLDQP